MRRPSPPAALLCLTALAVLATAVWASGAGAIPAKPRSLDPETVQTTALADVEARLAGAEAPPGAEPLTVPPAGSGIEAPLPSGFVPNLLAASRFWSVPGDPSAALAWVEAHPPGGLPLKMRSSSFLNGVPTGQTLSYEWPPLPDLADQRRLSYSASPFEGHAILVADSQAHWIQPHPASEVVPPNVRSVSVTRQAPGGLPHTEHISASREVQNLAALFASLPIAQPGTLHCPRLHTPVNVVTVVFRNSAGKGVARAQQEQPSSACRAMMVTVRGKTQPPLLEGSEFLRRLRGILP